MGRRAAGSATGDGVKLGAEGKGRWEAPSDGGQGKKGAEHWDTLLEGVGVVAAFGMRMKTRHDKGSVRNLGTYRRVSQVSKGPARSIAETYSTLQHGGLGDAESVRAAPSGSLHTRPSRKAGAAAAAIHGCLCGGAVSRSTTGSHCSRRARRGGPHHRRGHLGDGDRQHRNVSLAACTAQLQPGTVRRPLPPCLFVPLAR
jgi:hypothetical protein